MRIRRADSPRAGIGWTGHERTVTRRARDRAGTRGAHRRLRTDRRLRAGGPAPRRSTGRRVSDAHRAERAQLGSSYRRSCGSGRCGWSLKCRRFIRRSGRRWPRLRRSWGSGPTETLRKWVRRAVVDDSRRPGLTSEEHAEIKRLKREVAELRQANDHHVSTRATLCMRHRPRSARARRTEAEFGDRHERDEDRVIVDRSPIGGGPLRVAGSVDQRGHGHRVHQDRARCAGAHL
jgi:transposase-like protein